MHSVSDTASLFVTVGNAAQMSLYIFTTGKGILGHRLLDSEWKTDFFFSW